MDFEVTNASTQQNRKQMDEEFTTTAYPSVQENLKLPTDDQVILEEPASSAGTLSSLQNLDKELSFTNQFLMEKSQEDEPDKSNTEAEVQSMVTVPIHQDTSSVPLMTTPLTAITTTTSLLPPPPQPQQSTADLILIRRIGELKQHMADLIQSNLALEERLDKHGSRLYKLENLNIPYQVQKAVDEVFTDTVDWAMQAPLRARFSDLPTIDMKEILHQQMFEDNSYEAHEVHANLFDALEKSLEHDHSDQLLSDLDEARKKKRKRRALLRTLPGSPPLQPPPPPPLAGTSGAPSTLRASRSTQLPPHPPPPPTGASGSAPQQGSKASSSSRAMASTLKSMAWTTSNTRYESTSVSADQDSSPTESLMHDDSTPDEQASALASSYEPPAENSLLAKTGDMMTFLNWYCRQINKSKLTQADLEGQAYEAVKGSYPALSISKIKAASYPDFGLELLVPGPMWIDDVCTYDVSAKYGISHWWFTRQKFYIDRHESPSHQKEVRTHMRILNVVRIKAYSRYGYDYLSEIVLRRADHQEHKIAEKDFKNLYPSDFEDLNLLLLQGHLDHLSGSDKRMLSTAVKLWTCNLVIRQRVEDFQLCIESYQPYLNLTKPGWDATGYEFKHDYTIIESPRAVIFLVNNKERKIMQFNKIYKFSDGTLTRILETLDYRVKEFKIKRLNPGMNTRFWTEKDVTRIKEFITAIERRLKIRRIYRNLECFVGGRVRDIDYRLL
ncbi:hypothetical protein Tco_1184341 [Tanacetum coccineum]